jgi:hypothetical protein
MFWDQIEPVLTDRLDTAVRRAYSAFAKYRLSGSIEYCDCSVCMDKEQARALCTIPLNEIPQALLAEYTNSAHGYDRKVIEPQFKYFLSRYLELIAQCQPPTYDGLECSLSRLGSAGYRTCWPDAEREAVDDFFDAFLEASLDQLLLIEWPVGLRLEFDIGEVLVMIVKAGGDLERALGTFDKGADPEAAVHMASLRSNIKVRNTGVIYHQHHLDDHALAAQRIGAWLMRDSVTDRIRAAIDLLADPNYDDVLAMGL